MDEFRRFRHPVRNVYTVNIVLTKVGRIVSAVPDLGTKLRAELSAFADFTEDMARQ